MLKNEHVFFNTTCFIAGAPIGCFFVCEESKI